MADGRAGAFAGREFEAVRVRKVLDPAARGPATTLLLGGRCRRWQDGLVNLVIGTLGAPRRQPGLA